VTTVPAARAGQERRADLDWVRLALLLVAFVYRSARSWALTPASGGDWAVALILGRLPDTIDLCCIGLFLLLSGGSTNAALEHEGAGEFVLAKVLRLFVPFVFGAVLQSPAQVYLDLVAAAGVHRSFADFLRESLRGFYGVTPGGRFAFHGFHLAYLLLLLGLSLALLPLFLALRRRRAAASRGQRPSATRSAAAVLTLSVLPAALIVAGLAAGAAALGTLAASAVVLLGGFVLLGNAGLECCLGKWRVVTFAAGGALVAASFALPGTPAEALRGMGAWILSIGVFVLGLRASGRLPPPTTELREVGLPFFVLSRPVVVALGYLLRGLPVAMALRAVLVIVLSLICLVGASLAVRRFALLRFLFGLPLPR
jgi:glucans biosynthesis protein C